MNQIGFSKSTVCLLAMLVLAVGCDQPATPATGPFDNAPAESESSLAAGAGGGQDQ